MKTRVHISLSVSDIKESVEFYSNLFQTPATKVKSEYANFRMETPALHLALTQVLPSQTNKHNTESEHFGIELFNPNELENWHSKVRASGLKTITEKEVTCCYAVGNKFWAQDPDGNRWEFWVRLEEASSMKSPETSNQDSVCCPTEAKETCCG